MNFTLPTVRSLLAAATLCLPLAGQADPVPLFVPYEGAGNLSVFDAAAGSGGWTGSIEQSPSPAVPAPLSMVSVVLFTLNPATLTLNGTFEFTAAADLASTLFGDVSGSYLNPGILLASGPGGQFSIDYTITGGTGAYAGSSGYGLAFVDFDPAGLFNNYAEAGLLVITAPVPAPVPASVPAPATVVLAGLALLGALTVTSQRRVAIKPAKSAAEGVAKAAACCAA